MVVVSVAELGAIDEITEKMYKKVGLLERTRDLTKCIPGDPEAGTRGVGRKRED